jgi:hypothetical protein
VSFVYIVRVDVTLVSISAKCKQESVESVQVSLQFLGGSVTTVPIM